MVKTRHVKYNDLSFECPDYYDIGNFPSSDEVYKSIVALSKTNRECEIYVMVYRGYAFDNNAIRNNDLLRRYLELKNYYNISNNPYLPYCFNARIDYGEITIKSTIAFNFDHDDVIMIVGNVMHFSNYSCNDDIKIILKTVEYNEPINVAYFTGSVICSDCDFGYNASLHDSCPNCGSIWGVPLRKK